MTRGSSLRRPDETDDIEADDGAKRRYDEAVEIEACNSGIAECVEEKAADHSPHDADDDVRQDALGCVGAHDERRDPSSDTSENQECNDTHSLFV